MFSGEDSLSKSQFHHLQYGSNNKVKISITFLLLSLYKLLNCDLERESQSLFKQMMTKVNVAYIFSH